MTLDILYMARTKWFFGIRKQSVKRGIGHTGGRKRQQRGSAFPLAALAVQILGNLGGIVLKKLLKVVGGNNINDNPMVRDKILLRGSLNPQKVTVPEGRTFYVGYQKVSGKNLPANVTIKKVRAIGSQR